MARNTSKGTQSAELLKAIATINAALASIEVEQVERPKKGKGRKATVQAKGKATCYCGKKKASTHHAALYCTYHKRQSKVAGEAGVYGAWKRAVQQGDFAQADAVVGEAEGSPIGQNDDLQGALAALANL